MKTKAREVLELISMDGLVRLAHHLGVRWIGVRPIRWCSHERYRERVIDKILLETRRRVLIDRLHKLDQGPLGRKPE